MDYLECVVCQMQTSHPVETQYSQICNGPPLPREYTKWENYVGMYNARVLDLLFQLNT